MRASYGGSREFRGFSGIWERTGELLVLIRIRERNCGARKFFCLPAATAVYRYRRLDFLQVVPKLIEAVNHIDGPKAQVQGNRLPAYGFIVPTYSSSRRSQNIEILKLKRKAERLKLTRLITKIAAMLTQDSVTGEELCILNEHLKHLHTDLRVTGSHIVRLLSTTEAQAELDRVVDYNDPATVTSAKLWYRIRQLQESKNPALLVMSTEPVQRTPTRYPTSKNRPHEIR
ncbi:hypothetical protein HPB52_008926 [Rhipicephalus sanguineus]|uniref:Uncharacterized protein n=1 Tax=Rhipicephalus sanguineus TaxID=34632 RepID=A0A9D4PWF4_RHISA|nr:hypothetical protein HPB52_008926 [Rhipicephalus sanguineus]